MIVICICVKTNCVDFEEFCSFDDFYAEQVGDELTVFSPDVTLCAWLGLKHQLTN